MIKSTLSDSAIRNLSSIQRNHLVDHIDGPTSRTRLMESAAAAGGGAGAALATGAVTGGVVVLVRSAVVTEG